MMTFPRGCTPELKKMPPFDSAVQVIMCPPTGTTPGLPQPWCTDLKKPFTGHAAALVTAESSWDGECQKPGRLLLAYLLNVSSLGLQLSFFPPFIPSCTYCCSHCSLPFTLLPGSSCCCSCLCLFIMPVWVAASSLTLSKDSAVTGTVCSPCVRTQPDPTETKVFAHTLPVLGVGFSHQSHSLSPCNEWQEPCKIVCGVWRFERTQHRSYYYLLLMLSAE